MLRQNDLGRSEPAKNDILNVERQFFHAADRVLDPCPHTVNDVEIGLQSLAEHPDWVQHAVLPIDVIMLNNGMKECVLCRNAHLARIDFHVFDILLIDFIALLGEHDAPAIVEALKV